MSGGRYTENKNFSNMKRNLTLDLNSVPKGLGLSSILNSPDLNMLKVDTPELENMLLAEGLPSTPTPSLLFPKNVTAEQESFVGGFVEALSNLHNGNSLQESDSNASINYNDPIFIGNVKEEPQTVPNGSNSPPLSPLNMENQERMKLERKRLRNRLAASKCRSRKLERISKLEDKVKQLKTENIDLATKINSMKQAVGLLKLEVLEHNQAGCPMIAVDIDPIKHRIYY